MVVVLGPFSSKTKKEKNWRTPHPKNANAGKNGWKRTKKVENGR